MRKGKEILMSQIGQKLQDGIIQSFVLNGEIKDDVNVLYLKFNTWIRIVADDGTAISKVTDGPKATEPWIEKGDKIAYPLTRIEEKFAQFRNYIGLTLMNCKELIVTENNISCGVKFIFENNNVFSVYSDTQDVSFILFDDTLPENITEKEIK